MRLLKLLKAFSNHWRHYHCDQDHDSRCVCRTYLKLNKNERNVVLDNMCSRQVCPGCKNHCDLASPKCKRGADYAKTLSNSI